MKAFKAFTKHFEAPQRSVKIKIYVNFFSSFGIGVERVNIQSLFPQYPTTKKHKNERELSVP